MTMMPIQLMELLKKHYVIDYRANFLILLLFLHLQGFQMLLSQYSDTHVMFQINVEYISLQFSLYKQSLHLS